MKNASFRFQTATVLTVGLLAVHLANAATDIWTGAAGAPFAWGNSGNWSPSGPPGAADLVLFGNGAVTNAAGAANADNAIGSNTLVQGLLYTNTLGYHNTLLSPGATLTLSNTAAVDTLFVGGGVGVATTNTISGAGAALVVNNGSGNINIRHGNTAVGPERATLDLSGLDTLNATVARLLVAGDGGNSSTNSREVGTLFLARTNTIYASGTFPAISVGDNASNGVGGGGVATNLWSLLYLGQTNAIFADTITIGRSKCAGSVAFSPSVINVNAVAYIRGHTTSRVSTLSIGDDSAQTTSNQPEFGSADFSGGIIDLMADSVYVGRGPNGTGNAAGTAVGIMTFAAGNCDINTMEIGYQTYTTAGTASPAIGTLNINAGGSLAVNTSLRLANYLNSGSGISQGTLNVNGGSVTSKGGILAGGGTSTISLTNATLSLTNAGSYAGTATAPITSFSVTNSTLRLAVIAGKTNIVVNNFAADGSNRIQITSILGLSFPVQVPLIQYSGAIDGVPNFSVTLPPNYTGSLVNNSANSSIDLSITSGPILIGPLTWSGQVSGVNNGNWDVGVTRNWLASGNPSVYQDANPVTFDDAALGATAVNLTSEVDPSSVTVSNSALTYIFSGPSRIGGIGGLDKEGSGTLVLDESGGNNFSGNSVFNNGTVQVGANDGNGSLGSGTISNNISILFTRTNSFTVANAISGNGSLVQNGTGVLTLAGANSFTGAVNVLQGTLLVDNNSALGDSIGVTTVSAGATLDVGSPSLGANGVNLVNETIIVSGSGVGGNGAIVNSSSVAQQNAIHNLVLATDTTIGGPGDYTANNNPGRWDIRSTGGPASLSTSNLSVNLTKIGRNQFTIVNATVDPSLADINVLAGSFGVQGSSTLGDPSHTLTVYSNALLHLNAVTFASKNLALRDSGQVDNTAGITTFGGAVTLGGSNSFNVTGGSLLLTNSVGGSGSLYKIGAAVLSLAEPSTYTGNTMIAGGTLTLTAAGSIASPFVTVSNGATLDVSTRNDGTLTLGAGQTLTGSGTNNGNLTASASSTLIPGDSAGTYLTVNGSLELDSNSNLFNIATGLGDDHIAISSGLTLNGLSTIYIVPASPIYAGYTATLFQFGYLSGGASNLRVTGPVGYSFAIVDPNTTPGSIQVRVLTVGGNDVWHGGAAGATTVWDTGTTANWLKNGSPSVFSPGDVAEFDDGSLSSLVTLTGSLQPKAVLLNNNSQNYTFAGAGKLTGTNNLSKGGTGTLFIQNGGSNDFTGPINLGAGTLQVGDGTTNGNLPAVYIIDNGSLIFSRSDSVTVPGVISGSGSLTQNGTGMLTLSAVNTFAGPVLVAQGTLRVDGNHVLGGIPGTTLVTNNATLDLGTISLGANALSLSNETVIVSGAGVDGNGAIVNSSAASQQNALHIVVLAGNTTFGGSGDTTATGNPGRWDIRTTTGNPASLNTGNQPYNLTKIGGNQVSLVDVSVDPYLANIDVRGGSLGIQGSTTLGDNTKTLTVYSNSLLHLNTLTATPDKPVTMLDGALMDSTAGNNTWSGPINLNGSNVFNITGASLNFTAGLGGPGCLYKLGGGTLYLSASNGYTGGTSVQAGTLSLGGPGPVFNSSSFAIAGGATLDEMSAGGLLLLTNSQVLSGMGTNNGSLGSPAGTTVIAGSSNATLTVNGSVSLAGTTIVQLDKPNETNVSMAASSSIAYGGALYITILNGPLTATDSFRIFSAPSMSGTFTSLVPATPGLNLFWNTNQLAATGVLATVTNIPPNASFAFGPAAGSAPLTVSFTNTSQGAFVAALWNFGDGATSSSTAAVVTHTYTVAPSTNTVSLSITNSLDATTTFTVPNAVSIGSGAVAGLPRITRVQVSGGNLTLSGTNLAASSGHLYYLLSQTNLSVPRSNWTSVATNTFAADGGFTNTLPASASRRFYLLSVPLP